MIAQCPIGEDEEGCTIPESVRHIMSLFFIITIVIIFVIPAFKTLVKRPTRQSLLLLIGSLHWLSIWQWWPPMRGCRLYRPFWRPEFFFANFTNYMSPDGEFRLFHLVLGVFWPQIHVFWGSMGKISENEDYKSFVILVFRNFCWHFFVFQPRIYITL